MPPKKIKNDSLSSRGLALPPEIWNMVGKEIESQDTILALMMTCRAFRDLFTPFFRLKFFLRMNKIPTNKLRRKFLPAGLRNTRNLDILVSEFWGRTENGYRGWGFTYDVKHNDLYASFLIRMLKEISNLQSIRWHDCSCEESYGPSLILRDPQILQILKHTPTLKHISIVFSAEVLNDYTPACRCWIPLDGFKNLTSLELYNFYGNFTLLVEDLANALENSPGLKVLGLGVQYDEEDIYRMPDDLLENCETEFLKELCVKYGSRDGNSPLPLDTLRLGHGMFLYLDSSSPMYLSKLVQLDGLKSFHIYNGSALHDEGYDYMWPLDWHQLKDCKSLQQLSVTRFNFDVLELINDYGSSVTELIVTDRYNPYDEGLDYFELLDGVYLSMLFVQSKLGKRRDFDAWSERLNDPLVPGSGTDARLNTVLDRLHDGGAHLTRLGLCLDFETQWDTFSKRLANLPQLRQLRINRIAGRLGQYPRVESSLWPGVTSSDEIAYQYALLIHSKCPSLRFIQIEQCAWQVHFNQVESVEDGTLQQEAYLRPLDTDEIYSIELFALGQDHTQGGLSGPERPEEYIADALYNKAERSINKYRESGSG